MDRVLAVPASVRHEGRSVAANAKRFLRMKELAAQLPFYGCGKVAAFSRRYADQRRR